MPANVQDSNAVDRRYCLAEAAWSDGSRRAMHFLLFRVAVGALPAALLFACATLGFGEPEAAEWTVTCGLPTCENPLIDLFATDVELWPGASEAGHMAARKFTPVPHPESLVSTELWLLSPALGDWWRFKAIRVHPDDVPKLSDGTVVGDGDLRQVVSSPFLPEPVVIRGSDEEAWVDLRIMALLPDVSRLRCGTAPG